MMLMMQATWASIISIIGSPFLKSGVFRYPLRPPKNSAQAQMGLGLVFKTVRAHDAHFGRFTGPLKCLKNPSVSPGFDSKTHGEFRSGLGRGSGGAPWRNGGPMMQGRRHWRPPHGKARAMA